MNINLIVAFVVSMAIAAVAGKIIIPILRKMKAGQSIKEIGPKWHMTKQGTPTMGGIMFIIACGITVIAFGWKRMLAGNYAHLLIFALALLFGIIGYIDDYVKVKKKQNAGLTAWQKLLLQIVGSVVFIALMRYFGYVRSGFFIPFVNVYLPVHWVVYQIITAIIIVGAVNAVNLTDGIDGLAAGVTTPVALFFAFAAVYMASGEVAIFSAALAGGLVGFLFFNYNPAKVFMGDTGSLFLGGAVCGMAFALDMPIILLPVGIIYVIETLSVIIQVGCFKLTHGKRVFRMTPYHHHLELGGWKEKKIFWVFVAITTVMCVISYVFAII